MCHPQYYSFLRYYYQPESHCHCSAQTRYRCLDLQQMRVLIIVLHFLQYYHKTAEQEFFFPAMLKTFFLVWKLFSKFILL